MGAYLAFIFGAFRGILDADGWKAMAWALSTRPAAVLAYVFCFRENEEIMRLSDNVKHGIEPRLKYLLDAGEYDLLLEREDRRIVRRKTGPWQRICDWAVFLVLPVAMTLLACWRLAIPAAQWFVGSFILVFALIQVCLLIQHSRW